MVALRRWQFVALAMIVAVLSSGIGAAWTMHAAERECAITLMRWDRAQQEVRAAEERIRAQEGVRP
jgi:hypothetical protein